MPNTFSDNKRAPVNYLPSQDDDEIDLGELLATLVDSKWLIAFITVVVLAIGTAKAFLDQPVYKTDAMLQVEENSPSLGALESVSALMEGKVPVETEIELIKSRLILGTAVKNLNLEIIAKPKYFPVIGKAIARRFQQHNEGDEVSSPLFGLSGYAWGGESIHVDTFTVPSNWLGEPFILIAGEQGHFRLMYEDELVLEGEVGKLASKQFEDNQESVTLFVSLLKSRPDTQFTLMRQSEGKAIDLLKENITATEKGKKTGILELTMESTSPDSALQSLNEVANIYVRQNVEQKSAEAQKTLEFLEKQLPILKGQLETATTALNDYRTRHGSVDLDLETQGVLKGVVEIQTQITLLQQKRDELRQRFTESHPSVVSIDKQIARLQGQMNSNDKKIEVLPETQQVILRLARDVQVNTELYIALLNNTQTLRVSKAGTVGNVRIIDYAVLPTEPIKPKKALIIAVSFILGLILGVALAFIRKSLHRGVQDPDLIEKQLNIPVYATIPHSAEQEKINVRIKKNYNRRENESFILALENKDELAIESLRSLRTTLHFAFLEAQNNIIMIAGPSPGVGKSFVSVNLAAVLADAGKKILLIDADLRRGFINKHLGVSREGGLSDFISNTITLEEAIHKIPMANFDFIATGSIPPNPSELLLHERFGILLESISKNYDHVIIDSPPILAVTDAAIIGRIASVTLMVIRAGQHPMRELEQSTKRLIQAGVDIKGIVFNDVPETSSRYGYGYGKYVYQYSYQKSD
ncbi:MAG: polysaccharide biosynthesis tyrosine autokinase [Methylococcaceae bacterium]|jgi:tyrosine-protein kinase Etk/Wzc